MSQPKKLELKRNHGWKAKPGHAICVLDRGAVRFEFRRNWIVKQGRDSVQVHDCEPPDDNCVLGVSHFRVPVDTSDARCRIVARSSTFSEARFSRIIFTAAKCFSTKMACPAPRLSASIPTDPLPA